MRSEIRSNLFALWGLAAALVAVSLLGVACKEDVAYTPPDEAVTTGETTGNNNAEDRCERDGDCPVGELCDIDGTCLPEDQLRPCVDNDDDGYGANCRLGPDCDDTDFFRNPEVAEICNQLDDDCDGIIDEGDVCGTCVSECVVGETECVGNGSVRECLDVNGCATWLEPRDCPGTGRCDGGVCQQPCNDNDGDGYGDNCPAGPDCNDRNPFAFPGNPEVCDGYDNDCDDVVDEDCNNPPDCEDACTNNARQCDPATGGLIVCTPGPEGCLIWGAPQACPNGGECQGNGVCEVQAECIDNDGDGYGRNCFAFDCHDGRDDVYNGAEEVCDGIDNDCDGFIDDSLPNCAGIFCEDPHDTLNNPRPLLRGDTGSGYACPGTQVLWRLGDAPANIRMYIAAETDLGSAPLRYTLSVRNAQNQLEPVESWTGRVITASHRTTRAGVYYLGVELEDVNQLSAPYRVAWRVPENACERDLFEPNNSPSSGGGLTVNSTTSAVLCGSDLDFYNLYGASPGDAINVEIQYDGELLLELWQDGQIVSLDQRLSNTQRRLQFRIPEDQVGTPVISVRRLTPSSETTHYTLSVARWRDANQPSCPPDPFEASANGPTNDWFSRASNIGTLDGLDSSLCPGDVDIYDIGVRALDDQVDIRIDFDPSVNFDAFLFHEDRNGFLQAAISDNTPEVLPTRINRAGRYYVVVLGRSILDYGPYSVTQ